MFGNIVQLSISYHTDETLLEIVTGAVLFGIPLIRYTFLSFFFTRTIHLNTLQTKFDRSFGLNFKIQVIGRICKIVLLLSQRRFMFP